MRKESIILVFGTIFSIMALADVYDALTSKRVYKEAFSQEVAESTISAGIGSHFDPDISTVFMEHNKKDLL